MAPPLSVVPPSPTTAHPSQEYIVTARRLAPYVLQAYAEAHRDGRSCTLDDLCARYPVRRADLRRTVSALDANDLLDARRGRLTLQGFAVAIAVAGQCRIPVRDAIRGIQPTQAEQVHERTLAKVG